MFPYMFIVLLTHNNNLGHFIQVRVLGTYVLIIIFWPLYKNSYTPKNSRITWPQNFKSESEEFAHYLATLLRIRVRSARALLGHFLSVLESVVLLY